MTDIVERLRLLESGARWMCAETADTLEDAADEIERLRAECQRLAGEVSRAHQDALTWMERAAAANAAIEAARQQGRIEGATKLQAERDAARAEEARLREAGAAVLDYLLLPEWLNKPGGDSDVWAMRKSDLRALRAALAAKEPGHE